MYFKDLQYYNIKVRRNKKYTSYFPRADFGRVAKIKVRELMKFEEGKEFQRHCQDIFCSPFGENVEIRGGVLKSGHS